MTRYVEETYAKIAQAYNDEFFDDTSDLPLINSLVGQLNVGSKILDIGSGPGQLALYLSRQGFEVEGIDSSDEMLVIARKRVPNVTFTKMDMRALEYPDETFDGILASYSIIHIPTAELGGVLPEIKRVLKVGGAALFVTQEGEADQIVDEPLTEGGKIFMNCFTKERIARVLGETGFKLLSQATINHGNGDVTRTTSIGTLVARVE
jgi:ubiquinone/menaquinone biosynthesis C-methylase UbiE